MTQNNISGYDNEALQRIVKLERRVEELVRMIELQNNHLLDEDLKARGLK